MVLKKRLGRRRFLAWLGGSSLGTALSGAQASLPRKQRHILLQHSPLAGFQYYAGERLWPVLTIGQPLTLRRRLDNPYDSRAVEVWWGEEILGHLPRRENIVVSQMMDRGEWLSARIAGLKEDPSPWERVRVVVEMLV